MTDAIADFIDALVRIRWSSHMGAVNAQRVAVAMVYAMRDPNVRTARELVSASQLIIWRANESREAVEKFATAKASLIRVIEAGVA